MNKDFPSLNRGNSLFLLGFIVLICVTRMFSQTCVDFNGAAIYTQNFNGLGTSPAPQNSDTGNIINLSSGGVSRFLGKFDNAVSDVGGIVNIPGWAVVEAGSVSSSVSGRYNVSDGTITGANTFSYGTTNAPDRALGSLNDPIDRVNHLGGCFRYTGIAPINFVPIAFTGEVWRFGASGVPDTLSFEYAVNATNIFSGATFTASPAFDFTAPATVSGTAGARDGNATANRTIFPFANLNVTLNTNDKLYIRWRDSDITGNDNGLAIDDFSLRASVTAAGVFIRGRVLDFNGRGVSRVSVVMIAPDGFVRSALTNQFGRYNFDDVEVGNTYILSVSHKRFQFVNPTQIVSVSEDLTEVNFNANP